MGRGGWGCGHRRAAPPSAACRPPWHRPSPPPPLPTPLLQANNGFNLLVGDLSRRELAYLTNRGPRGVRGVPRRLGPGVYGLSNGVLGGEGWLKVDVGVGRLRDMVSSGALDGRDPPWDALMDGVMGDAARAPPGASLPDTGVPRALETALSSVFIPPLRLDLPAGHHRLNQIRRFCRSLQ